MRPSVDGQCDSASKPGYGQRNAIWIGVASLLMVHFIAARGSGQAVALRQLSVVTEQVISAEANDLSPIAAIRVSRQGRVAIWQQQDFQIRFFDAGGQSLGKFGRKGEGPGDFRALGMRGGWVGDTFWVMDPSTRRATVVDADLRLVRSVAWPQIIRFNARDSVSLVGSAGLVPYAQYSDGTMLTSFLLPPEAYRPSWLPLNELRPPLVRTTSSGKFLNLVAWDEARAPTKCVVPILGGNAQWAYSIPFCPISLAEVSGNGQFIATASPLRNGMFRLTMVSARGDTLYNRELDEAPRQIPKQVADSALTALHSLTGLSPLASQSFREKATASVKTVVLPQTYPPFVRLVVGEDGSAWVELWPDRNGRRWLGIRRDGKELGLVVLGQNIALKAAAGGRLWAVSSDSDGVQGVVRYGIKPAE